MDEGDVKGRDGSLEGTGFMLGWISTIDVPA